MPAVQIFNAFKANVANGLHDLSSDDLRIVLCETAPALTDGVYTDLDEIADGNGYTVGGLSIAVTNSAQSGGTYTLALDALTITASGGDIGPFQWVALINNTSATKPLIAFYNRGSAHTIPDGGAPYVINAHNWLTNA